VISKASFDALRSRYPAIGLDNIRNSGNYSENLRYELHNGARLLSDNARPSMIPEWIRGLNYVFVTVAVVLLTPILRRLNAMLRHRKSDQPVGEPESSEESWYVRLNGQCEALLAEIEHSPRDIAAETLNSWAQRSEALRQQVVQLEQEKKIEPKEATSLRAGLRHIAIELGEHRRTKERRACS
jgi:hypothetical protein